MTHYELLILILEKLGPNKQFYLSKKMGYHSQQVNKWVRFKEELKLTLRAIKSLCKIAEELGIKFNKADLIK